jgi:hypothetical protein
MFNIDIDERLHLWFEFRNNLEHSQTPFNDIIDFWQKAPRIPHNHLVDPFYPQSWPTPWEIIERNKYDDFTLAVMMGWTILCTERYKDSIVEVRTLVDNDNTRVYNVIYVDNSLVLNFEDNKVVEANSIPGLYRLENIVPLTRPR